MKGRGPGKAGESLHNAMQVWYLLRRISKILRLRCHSERFGKVSGALTCRLPTKKVWGMSGISPWALLSHSVGAALGASEQLQSWLQKGQKLGQSVSYAPCCRKCKHCIFLVATEGETEHVLSGTFPSPFLGNQTHHKIILFIVPGQDIRFTLWWVRRPVFISKGGNIWYMGPGSL